MKVFAGNTNESPGKKRDLERDEIGLKTIKSE